MLSVTAVRSETVMDCCKHFLTYGGKLCSGSLSYNAGCEAATCTTASGVAMNVEDEIGKDCIG